MTMVMDNQGRHYPGTMGYDHMYQSNVHITPQFSDPWAHQTSTSSSSFPTLSKTDGSRMSMPYSHMPPVSGPMAQEIPRSTYNDQAYSSPSASSSSYAPSYSSSLSYAQSLAQQQQQQQQQTQHRKLSDTIDSSRASNPSFGELDASRGMLALSHQGINDLTPRNIYEARGQRTSTDAYGFPHQSSTHSSLSNESGRSYPYYASSVGSVADSATDYSSAASDTGYESMAHSRTLPRPTQLMGAPLGPPAPQSMMSQFSSKMSGNTQKKHKCKVCDKRFTRPSSLQTHMYSHTGEKPFACDVDGCGRHFSVVSNLRRHKKVHKGESASMASHSDGED